ncbi:hypothetical protein HMPREF0080_00784 [Anaeroglobus geminatus F0357]|uniref:Uncharacterized protein n=1 Tax=Anaeroglobus geminatus F0357 TaxID=861450 RepID=G9YGL7_9FIRM|nr:hypothetical protein HMPREF0080_00784 [Anaeroglobus geminatus F0357]
MLLTVFLYAKSLPPCGYAGEPPAPFLFTAFLIRGPYSGVFRTGNSLLYRTGCSKNFVLILQMIERTVYRP